MHSWCNSFVAAEDHQMCIHAIKWCLLLMEGKTPHHVYKDCSVQCTNGTKDCNVHMKLHNRYSLVCGVWFTSMVRLATKHKL